MLFPFPQQSALLRRVVVTGAGIVTALGQGWKCNAEGFRVGRRAFRPISLFDASRQRVKEAAEAQLPEALPQTNLSRREAARLDRAGKLLLLAGLEAWNQSGWDPADDISLVLGTTGGGMSLGEEVYRQAVRPPYSQRGQATRVAHYQPQHQALNLQEALGISGPIIIIANACASGANAVGHAWELVRNGRTERALAGGYEALTQLIFAGFDSLQALSPTQCRPFDAQRDGLALGEGAAVLTLETPEFARKRGAQILGEIIGYGAVTDCHHLTQPHPQGDAAYASMRAACESARLAPEQIQYVNAHGTGTVLNDSAEAIAINRWADGHAAQLPVSSTKSSIGHLLGAAGAVEVIVSLMALQGQWLPPTSTLQTPERSCAFPLVRNPQDAALEHVLTNSFGFGGANATLILRRWA